MGRGENAVAAGTRQLEALALWLRAQRDREGITYAVMVRRINHEYTASVFSRAASGQSVPTRQVVEAYARACNAEPAEARRLWKAARYAQRRQGDDEFQDLADKLGRALSHPKVIETEGQLRRAMVQLRARDGQPSLAELQKRAGLTPDGRPRLPKSSLGAVLRGDAVPTRHHIIAFAEAMGLSRRKVEDWGKAWDRVVGGSGPHAPVLPRQPSRPPARSDLPGAVGPGGRPAAPTRPPWPIDTFVQPHAAGLMNFYTLAMTEDIMALQISPPSLHPANNRRKYARGPQPPLPPAGHTGSGLPIRDPRRYTPPVPGHRGLLLPG
ncbi:helix-turn-helix domain-containing protein [Streptomyces sp. CB02261]|uniref:helix-turn-helix domain-containing protein n=1 Tax=Streptomyces sp. CB02261 TaxID=1703940 RepID=UPI00093D15F5|nr:helix-turn-helix transcriptional regulator [Streptomyces sp. CB02261]OKJ52727.1 hypothetical protein AMK29_31540 [Streptomyces sp. CB02261]